MSGAPKVRAMEIIDELEPTRRGIVVPLDGSIAGWIVNNRKPVRVTNVHNDERFFGEVEQATGLSTDSILGVPLITKNKIVGVLEAINKQKGKFTDADESMLSVLGAQAAVAIENARLFQQSDLIAEFDTTVSLILRIRETDALVSDNPVLQSAIALRNPYVDALSVIQIAQLARKRSLTDGSEERGVVESILATTVSGIAQGLRNTG